MNEECRVSLSAYLNHIKGWNWGPLKNQWIVWLIVGALLLKDDTQLRTCQSHAHLQIAEGRHWFDQLSKKSKLHFHHSVVIVFSFLNLFSFQDLFDIQDEGIANPERACILSCLTLTVWGLCALSLLWPFTEAKTSWSNASFDANWIWDSWRVSKRGARPSLTLKILWDKDSSLDVYLNSRLQLMPLDPWLVTHISWTVVSLSGLCNKLEHSKFFKARSWRTSKLYTTIILETIKRAKDQCKVAYGRKDAL